MAYDISPQHDQFARFLHLPFEVRIQIYELLFQDNHFTLWTNFKCAGKFRTGYVHRYDHSILYSNKQIHDESLPVLRSTMRVRLVGRIVIYDGDISEALGRGRYCVVQSSPIAKMIPQQVLQNVTKVDSFLERLTPGKLLEAFPRLKLLHIRDPPMINQSCRDYQLRAPVRCRSRDDVARLEAGEMDMEIVTSQQEVFQNHNSRQRSRLVFEAWWPVEDRQFRVLITTRGYLDGIEAEKIWDDGFTVFEREITYNYDTLGIVGSENVYID